METTSKKKDTKIVIAIDGPAGSGKSSTAKIVAEALNYIYVDTGAMYRAVTLAWINEQKEYDEMEIIKLCEKIEIKLENTSSGQKTFLNNQDVSEDIRSYEVTKLVSPVSAIPKVREILVDIQRRMGEKGGIVMDGRDIGTVVFPNAELKVFLTADVKSRAERRYKELINKGISADIDSVEMDIIKRDKYDSTRATSPLQQANDAIEIDTSNMTLSQQANYIIGLAKTTINEIKEK